MKRVHLYQTTTAGEILQHRAFVNEREGFEAYQTEQLKANTYHEAIRLIFEVGEDIRNWREIPSEMTFGPLEEGMRVWNLGNVRTSQLPIRLTDPIYRTRIGEVLPQNGHREPQDRRTPEIEPNPPPRLLRSISELENETLVDFGLHSEASEESLRYQNSTPQVASSAVSEAARGEE